MHRQLSYFTLALKEVTLNLHAYLQFQKQVQNTAEQIKVCSLPRFLNIHHANKACKIILLKCKIHRRPIPAKGVLVCLTQSPSRPTATNRKSVQTKTQEDPHRELTDPRICSTKEQPQPKQFKLLSLFIQVCVFFFLKA